MFDFGDFLFEIEVLKVLLQCAWADLEVQAEEAAILRAHIQRMNLPATDLARAMAWVDGTAPLPPPDLGMLRVRREEVFVRVRELLVSDLRLGLEEQEILAELRLLLS